MQTTLENGSPHVPAVGDRHTPVLNGDIYCSPACGMACKKAEFDAVSEQARIVAFQLGSGWEPHVWENCGWNFEVKKGMATVSAERDGGYLAQLEFTMSENQFEYLREVSPDPRAAVEAVGEIMKARILALQRALSSVSLDVIEIEFESQKERTGLDVEHGIPEQRIEELAPQRPSKVELSEEQMLARIKLLADEMDANEEENQQMQDEIDQLYKKIDALRAMRS